MEQQDEDALKSGDLLRVAGRFTGDTAIAEVAVVVWPNEASRVERAAGGMAMRLVTGGLVGDLASKTIPFGVLAVSPSRVWRVEAGYLFDGVELGTVGHVREKGVVSLLRDEEMTATHRSDADGCAMTLVTPRRTLEVMLPFHVRSLKVTDRWDLDGSKGTHPFFRSVDSNRELAPRLIAAIKAVSADASEK